MQEEPFGYSQYVPYTHRKFFRGIWSQKFTENWQFRVFLDTPREIVFLFQNNVYYDDSFDILQLVRRMFKIFLLTSRATLRQPFRCPQNMFWSHRKFLRGIWSDWSLVLHQKRNFLVHFDFKNHLQFRIFSKVFHVSCNIFRLVRLEHFYVSLPLRTNLLQHFTYPQNGFWMCRKFFRGFWNHLSLQWKDHFLTLFLFRASVGKSHFLTKK